MPRLIHMLLILLLAAAPQTARREAPDQVKQAGALFEAAQTAHQAGELERALGLYAEALRLDPSLWQAEFQRSLAYLALNRLSEARGSIDRVIEQLKGYSDSDQLRALQARAQIVVGEIALAESKNAEAEAAFRRALELNPKAGAAHAGLAELHLAADRINEAAAEAKAAVGAGDERASTYTLLGVAQTLARQYDEALANLNEALRRNPSQPLALRYRAEVYIARRQTDQAIADLRSALAFEPITTTRLRLAQIYGETGRETEAVALYEEVLKAEPENSTARAGLAASRLKAGQTSEAIVELERLVKAEPNRADLRAQLGELYLTAQPERALEQYREAARLAPDQLAHQIGVTASLVKLRRFPEAAETARQVLARGPSEEIAYYAQTNLATSLFEQEDYAGAARSYLWLLEHPRDQKRAAITLYLLGICFDRLGDLEQALKAYRQFLSLASPENQLEIDKVKLRLPSLERQLREGQGRRKRSRSGSS